jgi:hypothetical protein
MYIPKNKEVHSMVLHFNVDKNGRKAMVQAIEKELGIKAKYLGVPSCAYQIGDYRVERDGTLTWGDMVDADPEGMDRSNDIINACVTATVTEPDEWEFFREQEEAMDEQEEQEQPLCDGVTISVPRDGFTDEALDNLRKLVESKAPLMKKAFLTDELPIIVTDEQISFPWFANGNSDSVTPYTRFIAAICDMAKKQKRITAKPKENENEKYAFRCFLLRLGFIGDEYKADRKILLANLEGSSAFKSGTKGGEQ